MPNLIHQCLRLLIALLLISASGSGCVSRMLNESDLPAPPPPGVIGLVYPSIELAADSIKINAIAAGTGFYISEDQVLVTAHQNFRKTGTADPNQLNNRYAVPYLILMGSFPRLTPWQTMQPVGGHTIASRIEDLKSENWNAKGNLSGYLDAGWCVLNVYPPHDGQHIRIDFDRPLGIDQEVFILRPTIYSQIDTTDGQPVSLILGDMTPFMQHMRELLDTFSQTPLEFHAWHGYVKIPPQRVLEDTGTKNKSTHEANWIYFGFDQDLSGASGSPVLIHEDGEWIAIGMFTSAVNFDFQLFTKYQYGFFVRPDLGHLLEKHPGQDSNLRPPD